METEVRTSYITADSLLFAVSHRPWLPPDAPWVMTQTWNNLLFLHYAFEPQVLRQIVPDALTLDLYGGQAWLSITPFQIAHTRPPGIPPIPSISTFPELNVRTYVTYDGKPGVYFFSLDAGNLSAVWGARIFYRLPYWHASMKLEAKEGIHFRSKRIHGPSAKDGMPEFAGTYRPSGEVFEPRPRSLDDFLTGRYCLYAFNRQRLYRTEIHHVPWPLQPAEVAIERNTLAEPLGLTLPDEPMAHFSRMLKVLIWAPERLL